MPAAPTRAHRSRSRAGRRTERAPATPPVVAIVMGSRSDWESLAPAAEMLDELGVSYEARIVSAHRTPDWMFAFAESAESRGLQVIIAGAGGAAHLPGMLAAHTVLPVLGVPVTSRALQGIDSLLSIVQMPRGTPVATMAIGKPGAANAALYAAKILAARDPQLRERIRRWKKVHADEVLKQELP